MAALVENLLAVLRLGWPPALLALIGAALVASSRARRHPLVGDAAGAILSGAAFAWLAWRGQGSPDDSGAVPIAILVAAGFGLLEVPLWTKPRIAPLVRLPAIGWLLGVGLGRPGLEPNSAILAGGLLFVVWWATKEAAARHSGLVLVALGAASSAAAALVGLASGAGRLLAAGALVVFVVVPVVIRAPRVVAGRGFLAPTLIALAASWIPATAAAEPPLSRWLLALAAVAPALLFVAGPGRSDRPGRPAAAILLLGILAGLAVLVALGRMLPGPS